MSHAQIGVISAPICAFCHRSLGRFSIISAQTCPLQSYSGSKMGQEQGTPILLAWRPKFFLRDGMAHAIIKVQSQVRYYDPASVNVPKERLKELTLLLHDERNGLERVLLHFSHFEKETQKLDERLYRITLQDDQDDETELLIRVLSFGPVLEVVAPLTFRQLMRNRIQKQALYADREISQ